MIKILDLPQETQHTKLYWDNLMVNDNFPIIVHILGATEMDMENIEVEYDKWFMQGSMCWCLFKGPMVDILTCNI